MIIVEEIVNITECKGSDCPKQKLGFGACRNCYLRDLSDLDERFTPYYNSGERVEVVNKEGFEDLGGYGARTDGKKARFYVGISTGWKPIYIQIYRRDSMGGQSILSCAVESVRGLGIYR